MITFMFYFCFFWFLLGFGAIIVNIFKHFMDDSEFFLTLALTVICFLLAGCTLF